LKSEKKHTLTPLAVPLLVSVLLVLLVIGRTLLSGGADADTSVSEQLLRLSVVQIVIYVFPCIIYYFLKGRRLNTGFMLSAVGPGNLLFIFVSTFMLIAGNLLIKYLYYVTGTGKPTGVDHLVSDLSVLADASPAMVLIALALVPAVCEELFFRGLVLSEYKIYGTFNAVMFSAVCFSMIHFSVSAFPLYLFSGVVLGMTAAVTRSVFVSISIHFISNVLSIYMSDSFMRVSVQKSGKFFVLFILMTVFVVSCILVAAVAERICYRRATDNEPRPESRSIDNIAAVFLSPGFFGLALVFLLIIILI